MKTKIMYIDSETGYTIIKWVDKPTLEALSKLVNITTIPGSIH
jgi:hypothetical protein